jgi:hypothetical protein
MSNAHSLLRLCAVYLIVFKLTLRSRSSPAWYSINTKLELQHVINVFTYITTKPIPVLNSCSHIPAWNLYGRNFSRFVFRWSLVTNTSCGPNVTSQCIATLSLSDDFKLEKWSRRNAQFASTPRLTHTSLTPLLPCSMNLTYKGS